MTTALPLRSLALRTARLASAVFFVLALSTSAYAQQQEKSGDAAKGTAEQPARATGVPEKSGDAAKGTVEQPARATGQEKDGDTPQSIPRRRRGFVDANGDGINDRSRRAIRQQRGNDTFIDSDGDGINDTRTSGLGTGMRSGTGRRRGR